MSVGPLLAVFAVKADSYTFRGHNGHIQAGRQQKLLSSSDKIRHVYFVSLPGQPEEPECSFSVRKESYQLHRLDVQ